MPLTERVYVDASVFVAALVGEDEPQHSVAVAFIEMGQQGGFRPVISGLVMAESVGAGKVRAPQSTPRAERRRRVAKVRDFFDQSAFDMVDLGRLGGLRAAEYCVKYDLKGPDACHLAMAILAGCGRLATLDGGLLKVGEAEPPVSVVKPWSLYSQADTLFGHGGS